MMWLYRADPRRRYYRPTVSGFNGGRRVPVDVHADDEAYIVRAAVPGLKPEDLKIDILDNLLTLHGEVKLEGNGQGEALLREIPLVSEFTRRLRLPAPVDADQAEAKIEHGILTVRIPKTDAARPKQITIKGK